jgi:hypothetical protein
MVRRKSAFQFRMLFLAILILLATPAVILAQHQELDEDPNIWGDKSVRVDDSLALIDVFRAGTLHGHFRYFFMATDNAGNYRDYVANAAGGGIRFETSQYKGFRLAVSGFYTFNLYSSDLSKRDPVSGAKNRYEIGLFNVEDPTNMNNLDRLEEFYLNYSYKKSQIWLGKQLLNTPFINLQDGRMRPTAFEGLYFNIQDVKNLRLQGGVLTGVAPRGTIRYMGIGESVGVFPTGIATDGTPSNYSGQTKSNYLGMLGATYNPSVNMVLQFWNLYADNLMNSSMQQVDWIFAIKNGWQYYLGAQSIQQFRAGTGGDTEPGNRYFNQDRAFTFGGRVGIRQRTWNASFNYNRITAHGQYLMPREWGRDAFYTFLPRERNEGLGDVNAYVARLGYHLPEKRLKINAGLGYFDVPDVLDFRLNKYGVPSYMQFNVDLLYAFSGFWEGLELHFLMASKFNRGETRGNPRYIANKVDMVNYNLVVNYRF